jgi:hypothetical protein
MSTHSAGQRRKVNDAALAGVNQVRNRRAGNQHHRGEVDIENLAPESRIDLLDGPAADQVPGIVDQNVQPAEQRYGLPDHLLRAGLVGDIGLKALYDCTGRRKAFDFLGALAALVVVNGDVAALPQQFFRNRAANPLASAGD